MHVWQGREGGAGEGAGARERRPQTSGPFSPVRPPSGRRGQSGRRARGAGLTAAARGAGRREGGGAARGGRSCPRARRRRSAPHPPAQPRHETLTAARPARLRHPGTDRPRRRRRRRTRGSRPGAKCGRAGRSGGAQRGEWLRAPGSGTGCEGRALPRTLAAEAGRGVAGLPGGWPRVANAGKRYPGLPLSRPEVRAPRGSGVGRGAPSTAGRRRGAAVAIQGLRAAAMQREEAGGGEEEGRARGERASERAPRLLAGTAARSEVARGAGRQLLRARAARGSAARPGPGREGLSAATGGSCQKFYRACLGKARGNFGE